MVLPAISRMLLEESAKSQEALDRQRAENEMWKSGDITQAELGLRTGANILDASVNPMLGKMLTPVMKAGATVADYAVPDVVPEWLAKRETLAPFFEAAKKGVEGYEELKRESPRTARNIQAALTVADVIPTVKGASVTREGLEAVNALTGPESSRGMLTASANNFIGNYYDPNPLKKTLGIATWLPKQVVNTATDIISPTSRAGYRDEGISRSTQKIIARAQGKQSLLDVLDDVPYLGELFKSEAKETGIHRGVAQAQYVGRVHAQSERKGKADLVDEIIRRSDVVDVFDYYEGAYKDTIKDKKLKPYYRKEDAKKQMPLRISDDDLDFIEQHFSTVWTEPSLTNPNVMVPFKEAEKPLLAIKNPGAGQRITGSHYDDVFRRAPFVIPTRQIFKDAKKIDPEELLVRLSEQANLSQQLKETKKHFKIVGQAKDGGVWVSGSMPGSAITEGGINYLTKVTPDGKMIGVMSDEHNLFEGIAAKVEKYSAGTIPALSAMKHFLPRRLIAVTPPMAIDIKSKATSTRKYEMPQGRSTKGKTYPDILDEIVDYTPPKEVVEAERRVNAGIGLTATGLLSTTAKQQEEEQQGP